MQIQVDIGFEQLMEIIKKLPANKLSMLKAELGKKTQGKSSAGDLEAFLLSAPTFTKTQIAVISKTRKAINQWRED